MGEPEENLRHTLHFFKILDFGSSADLPDILTSSQSVFSLR
jgi:hypothetical protein